MRPLVIVSSLAVLAFASAARAQAGDAFAQAETSSADGQGADLEQRVQQLEDRVSALEGQPEQDRAASAARAQAFSGALERVGAIQSALQLGQSDVAAALEQLRAAVQSEEPATEVERVHARAASGALDAALDAVGRDDLFNARGALDVAALELSRARDLALAR